MSYITKIVNCSKCGNPFEKHAGNQVNCPQCAKLMRSLGKTAYMAKRRTGKESVSCCLDLTRAVLTLDERIDRVVCEAWACADLFERAVIASRNPQIMFVESVA